MCLPLRRRRACKQQSVISHFAFRSCKSAHSLRSSQTNRMSPKKTNRCWPGYEPVPGKEPNSLGSCRPKADSQSTPSEKEFKQKRKRQLQTWADKHSGSRRSAAQHLSGPDGPSSSQKRVAKKKTSGKKTNARKSATKKSAGKEAAPRKSTPKRSTTRKSPAKKTVQRKRAA